jgi:hypothetical protein
MTSSASPPSALPLSVFISYSHRDEDFKDELVVHLANLKRQQKISAWQDRDIEAGAEWEAAIKQQLETAEIILLLISPRFLASNYCYDVEMQRAIARHDAGTARVIPILLKPVDWQDTPFSKLQTLPISYQAGAKPITQWDDQDAAFVEVVKGIRGAVESLQVKKTMAVTTAKPTTTMPSPLGSPSHNLTEKQLKILKWMVEEVRADRLNEEIRVFISVMYSIDNTSDSIDNHIENYEGTIPEIRSTTLDALENDGCLTCNRRSKGEYRCALTRRAYEIADSRLGVSLDSLASMQSSPAALSSSPGSMNSFQRQRLETQQTGLQQAWTDKMEQLTSLRQALAIESSASVKFQLQKQVQTAEAELAQLESQLEKIEQDLTNSDPPKK